MDRVDCVVVGAGVVGLAVARALALAGREVLILEAEAAFGTASARNSEVIHAGIYYPRARSRAGCAWPGVASSTISATATAWPIDVAAS